MSISAAFTSWHVALPLSHPREFWGALSTEMGFHGNTECLLQHVGSRLCSGELFIPTSRLAALQ